MKTLLPAITDPLPSLQAAVPQASVALRVTVTVPACAAVASAFHSASGLPPTLTAPST